MAADLKLSLVITADGRAAITGIHQVQKAVEGVGASSHTGAAQAGAAFDGLGSKIESLGRNLGALLGIGFGAAMVKDSLMVGDAYNVLQSRIQDATRATGDYAAVSQSVFDISQKTGVVLGTAVSLYQSLSRSAGELGAKQADILKLTETVQKLGVVGGASTSNLNAGLLQFGQMLAGGVAHAEEMNSLLENIPAVAEAIARGMGKTTGELRAAVIEGKVLSQDVMAAILSQSADVDARFKNMPMSIERATTELSNAWSLFIGNLVKSSGMVDGLTSAIKKTASRLTEWGTALDPTKIKIDEISGKIAQLELNLRNLGKDRLAIALFGGSSGELYKNTLQIIMNLQQELADLQGLTETMGADPGMVQSWIDADQTLEQAIQTEKEMNEWFRIIKGTAVNSANATASAWTAGMSQVVASIQDVNNELRVQIATFGQGRGHLEAYRNEMKLQGEIDKARATATKEGTAAAWDSVIALEEQREAVARGNAEMLRNQSTLEKLSDTHRVAAPRVRAHSVAKRELAKETRDYAREADRAIDFIERENQALYDTSDRLLKLAAEYGNSDAKAILYQRQLEEITRALEAMGATADEVRAAQNRLWEEMTTDGQAAKQIREANEKAAKEAADEWKRQSDEIERSLTDALMRGFEGGKGFAENLIDTLKNMFNTLVLKPIIKAIVQPVAGAVAGMMPGVSSASAEGANGGFDLNSVGSVVNGLFGGGGLVTAAGDWLLGTALGSGGFGMGLGAGLSGAGLGIVGAFEAIGAGVSTAVSGAVAVGLGQVLGAMVPIVGWAVAIAAALGVFDSDSDVTPDLKLGMLAGRHPAAPGEAFVTPEGNASFNLETTLGPDIPGFAQHIGNAEAAQQILNAVQAALIPEELLATAITDATADRINAALEDAAETMRIEEPEDFEGGIGEFFGNRLQIIIDNLEGPLRDAYDQLAALQNVDVNNTQEALQLVPAMIAVAQATGDLKTVFSSLLDPTLTSVEAIAALAADNEIYAATLVRLGVEVVAVNSVLDSLGVTMLPLNILGAESADALIKLAGGMENLTSASAYFFEHFYTEAEQQQRIVEITGQVIASFNEKFKDTIAASGAVTDGIIDTKEELRTLVESLDLTTEAGREAYLAAMALAPTLVENADALEALGQAATDSAAAITAAAEAMDERLSRQGEFGDRFGAGGRFGPGTPGPTSSGADGDTGAGAGDFGGWQPWHDAGSASGAAADLTAQLADFMAGIQSGIDKLQLQDVEYAIKSLGLEFDAMRAKAEALGASAEDLALIDQLEALRQAALEAAQTLAKNNFLGDLQNQIDQLTLDDFEYAALKLQQEMAALRAQAEALGLSTELIDQLEALRQAEIEAAAAAEAARQAEEAQAEAERQAREQAEAAYETLADAEQQAQHELDALANEMEEFNRAVQSVRDGIAGAVLSILRDQPGWSETEYQRQRIAQLRQRIDQTSGFERLELVRELQEAIIARYQAERAELEKVDTVQTDLYSAMEKAHQTELQHYQDVQAALKDLGKYVDSLRLNDQLSTLTPYQKLEEARQQFYATLGLAQGGDAQAIRDLTGAASAYLQDARQYFASGEQYTAIFDAVTAVLEDLTGLNVTPPMEESEWRDFMAGLQSTQTEAVIDLSGIQDHALKELQALDELLTVLTGEQALAAQEQQAAILGTLQAARDDFATFAETMPEDLAQAANEIGEATDNAAERITTAITGAIQSMDQHLADTNANVSANTQAIAGLQAQLAALSAQNAALSAQNAGLQAQLDSNTANLA